jgi:two-component system chemotaxis response regulator CheB
MVGSDPEFEVVGTAGNASEALDALRSVAVDIVLLDVEMPGTSGLEALPDILRAGRGARVLIVSSMAEAGAEVTVRALAEGAADTLPKPGTGYFAGRFSQILGDKLRRIGRATRQQVESSPASGGGRVRLRAMPDVPLGCVALGASTGGLHALLEFLRALPPAIRVPILVTQHLPPVFMPYFARQLQAASGRPACVVADGQALTADMVHIAPGDAHLTITGDSGRIRVRHDRKRAPSGCLPSVDPMLTSLGEVFGEGGVGVMLSGMGRDGVIGSRLLVERGGAMLAQDENSAAVWGMPRAVAEAGLASAVLPPIELARRIAERAETVSWK